MNLNLQSCQNSISNILLLLLYLTPLTVELFRFVEQADVMSIFISLISTKDRIFNMFAFFCKRNIIGKRDDTS